MNNIYCDCVSNHQLSALYNVGSIICTMKELMDRREKSSTGISLSLPLSPSIAFSKSLAKLKASESYGDPFFCVKKFISFSNLTNDIPTRQHINSNTMCLVGDPVLTGCFHGAASAHWYVRSLDGSSLMWRVLMGAPKSSELDICYLGNQWSWGIQILRNHNFADSVDSNLNAAFCSIMCRSVSYLSEVCLGSFKSGVAIEASCQITNVTNII